MSDWNTKIIEEFRANGGKVGGPFEGASMIILHTIGAKSGSERENPVVYIPQADDAMVVIASKAGARRTRTGTTTSRPIRTSTWRSAPRSSRSTPSS